MTTHQGFKIVRTDGTSFSGFRWPLPMPGERVRVVADDVNHANDHPCPSRPGDGLCVALTARGASSDGTSLLSCIGLLLEYDDADVLGHDADKLRVSAVDVVGIFDVLALIRLGLCADLSGANLSRASLSRANLSHANLSHANLSRADLSDADLSDADLSGADLYRANLSDAKLYGVDLSGAYLSGADLSGANLSGANLSDANLSGAVTTDAIGLPNEAERRK